MDNLLVLCIVCIVLVNSTQADECAVHGYNCYNGGTCHMKGNNYECVCAPFFTGNNCENIDIHYKPISTSTHSPVTKCVDRSFCETRFCANIELKYLCPVTCGLCITSTTRKFLTTSSLRDIPSTTMTVHTTTRKYMTATSPRDIPSTTMTFHTTTITPEVTSTTRKYLTTSSARNFPSTTMTVHTTTPTPHVTLPTTTLPHTSQTTLLTTLTQLSDNSSCADNSYVKCHEKDVCVFPYIARFCPLTCGQCSPPTSTTHIVAAPCRDSKLIQCDKPNICSSSLGRYCRLTCGGCTDESVTTVLNHLETGTTTHSVARTSHPAILTEKTTDVVPITSPTTSWLLIPQVTS